MESDVHDHGRTMRRMLRTAIFDLNQGYERSTEGGCVRV
jgi:hypothetical protein